MIISMRPARQCKTCSLTQVLSVLKLTEQYKALNPMQQVPAVEIDGITLSQSVSSQTLYPCNPIHDILVNQLEYYWKWFLAHTAGSDPVHRWDQARPSASPSRPKETCPGSDDKWCYCLWDTASAGENSTVQMITQSNWSRQFKQVLGCKCKCNMIQNYSHNT